MDGESDAIAHEVVELAKEGDRTPLKLVLERVAPRRRNAPAAIKLPDLKTSADARQALAALLKAIAAGELSPLEALQVVSIIDRISEFEDFFSLEARIWALEERQRLDAGEES
jgi:hypothetical protein